MAGQPCLLHTPFVRFFSWSGTPESWIRHVSTEIPAIDIHRAKTPVIRRFIKSYGKLLTKNSQNRYENFSYKPYDAIHKTAFFQVFCPPCQGLHSATVRVSIEDRNRARSSGRLRAVPARESVHTKPRPRNTHQLISRTVGPARQGKAAGC
jgi:hypothetical protein